MPAIQSVTGPVEGADLGYVLAHEHVAASSPGVIRSWPALHGGRDVLVERGARALATARAAGVDPARVAIGHSDDSDDVEYLSGLAGRGYRIAMDRIPNGALPNYGGQSVADRMDMIARLVDRGFGDRILLGHDDPVWAGLLDDEDAARHQASNPHGLAFMSRVVLPGLAARGLPPEVLRALTVDNPRAWLVGA